jgi:hypothetical protein
LRDFGGSLIIWYAASGELLELEVCLGCI